MRISIRRSGWLAALILLSAPLAAQAQPGPGGPPPDRPFLAALERLDLKDDVRDKVRQRAEAARQAEQPLRQRLREAHERMRSLMEAAQPDKKAILAQADAVGALETEMRKLHLGLMVDVVSLLTPEQRQALRDMQREHGRPGGPGGPPPWAPRGPHRREGF